MNNLSKQYQELNEFAIEQQKKGAQKALAFVAEYLKDVKDQVKESDKGFTVHTLQASIEERDFRVALSIKQHTLEDLFSKMHKEFIK